MWAPRGQRAAGRVGLAALGFCRRPDTALWVAEHAPGPQIAAGVEGTRSYGIGLTRVLSAAGMRVIEVEQPRRADRRGRGKSDPIDAHLAALSVLRRQADTLPEPRADGVREGLRILLGARRDLTSHQTGRIDQLRALLLSEDDTDRALARGPLPEAKLAAIARRRGSHHDPVEQTIRRRQCRRLALAIIYRRTVGSRSSRPKTLRSNTAPGAPTGVGTPAQPS